MQGAATPGVAPRHPCERLDPAAVRPEGMRDPMALCGVQLMHNMHINANHDEPLNGGHLTPIRHIWPGKWNRTLCMTSKWAAAWESSHVSLKTEGQTTHSVTLPKSVKDRGTIDTRAEKSDQHRQTRAT